MCGLRKVKPDEKQEETQAPALECYLLCNDCGHPIVPGNGVTVQGAIYALDPDNPSALRGALLAGGEPVSKTLTAWHTHCLWRYLEDRTKDDFRICRVS